MIDRQDLASNGLTDLLFEEPSVARCLVAPDDTVLRANAEWLRSTGYTVEDVIGANLIDLFPDVRDMALAARARADHRVELPRHALTVHGREAWWDASVEPVPMEGGTGLLITAREVSRDAPSVVPHRRADGELRATTAELATSEARFRAMFEATTDAVVVVDPTGPGRVLSANTSACRLFGYSAEEFCGLARDAMLDGDDPRLASMLLARQEAGQATAELAYRRKDGTRFTGEVTSAVFAEPGGQLRAVAIIRDVTDRKQHEETLNRRDAQFRALIEEVHSGVALVDASGKFTLFNRRFLEMFGLSREADLHNVNSQDWGAWQVFDEAGRLLRLDERPVRRAALTNRPVRDQLVAVRLPRGDDLVWMLISAEPLLGRDGGVGQVICTYHDVTVRKRSEEALRESEREARARAVELEAILASIADGVLVYDSKGVIVRSNPAAQQILNLPEEVRAMPVMQRIPRHYRIWSEDGRLLAREEVPAIRAMRGATVRDELVKVQSGSDAPRWLRIGASPLRLGGAQVGAVLSMTDITERKRAEEDLKVVTRLYAVLSRVNEAIVRIGEEASLYQEVCRIVADEGGFPLAWVGLVQGKAVVPAAWWGRASDYLSGVRVEIDGELGNGPGGTCIRENRPVINDDFDVNPATWPWREAAARHGLRASAAFPLRCNGAVVGNLTLYAEKPGAFTPKHVKLLESLGADVSYALDAFARERQRARAESALRVSEEKLRLAKEAAGMGAWDWNLITGELVWTDRCKALFGLAPHDAVSYEVFKSTIHRDDVQPMEKAVRDALASGHEYNAVMRVPWADGSIRWVAAKGRAFFDGGGRAVRMIGMALDITDRKRAEEDLKRANEALREADRRKDEFLSAASHELRTPLTTMSLQTQGLLRMLPRGMDEARIRSKLASMDAQVGRLNRLVGTLLDVSRISAGGLHLQRESCDLAELSADVVERFEEVAERSGTSLALRAVPASGAWDRLRVEQVLTNLLDNAMKYAPGSAVDVTVEAEDGQAVLSVRDHGPGISPESQTRIFQQYERAVEANVFGGLGLGLWISREIVEAHGGSISVESEPGKGATFTVRLPGAAGSR